MNYQVGSVCYDTAVQAAQASASKEIGAVVSHGGSAFVVNAATVEATGITYSFVPVSGGAPVTIVAPYSAQPCNMLTYQDGLHIGWMVAAAWLSAYAVLFIARSLRGETGGDYGNT
jgi:hypothetical protein